jgi:hypothetical protein
MCDGDSTSAREQAMREGKLTRNIARRLERLERRIRVARASFSLKINFVSPTSGVTSTLVMEAGNQVWTRLNSAPILNPIPRPCPTGQ